MAEMTAPRFSIVVPACNAENTLAETLDAVKAQSFADWECVVVNDGSTDGTKNLAESCGTMDARIRVTTQANQGMAGAYNTGVRAARGRYIVICSADDLLLPDHLSVMDGAIQSNPGYGIYSSNGETSVKAKRKGDSA